MKPWQGAWQVSIGLLFVLHNSRYPDNSCTVFNLEPSLRFLAFTVPGFYLGTVIGTQTGSSVLTNNEKTSPLHLVSAVIPPPSGRIHHLVPHGNLLKCNKI